MLWKRKTVAETEEIFLRRWSRNDFEDYCEFMGDPEVTIPAGMHPASTKERLKEYFTRSLNDEQTYAIVLKAEKKAVGQIKFQDEFRRYKINAISIGYELSRQYWGKGLMPQALRCMVKLAFEGKGVDIVGIGHFTVNARSRRVIEKVGFHHEGTIRMGFMRYDGTLMDDEIYSMTRAEYDALAGDYASVKLGGAD